MNKFIEINKKKKENEGKIKANDDQSFNNFSSNLH